MTRWSIPAGIEPALRLWMERRLWSAPGGKEFTADLFADWSSWIDKTTLVKPADKAGLKCIKRRAWSNWIGQLMPKEVRYRSDGRSAWRGIILRERG